MMDVSKLLSTLVATTPDEALIIARSATSLGKGYPVYVIPWGMGNISYEDFLCDGEEAVRNLWDQHITPVATTAFHRAHVIHCFGSF